MNTVEPAPIIAILVMSLFLLVRLNGMESVSRLDLQRGPTSRLV